MTASPYNRALGARLLSEANDIKRTPESLAAELGMPLDHIRGAIRGELDLIEYRNLFERIAARYPIAFTRLWMEPPDTKGGVLHMTAAESAASSRVFDRPDGTGRLAPYYEYRDTAMSATAPFRPEWIRQLRVVTDLDPGNPEVAYNKGHFLHQTTLFVGPVNFYWEIEGRREVAALDTGDSNYITPFWPHSFTSRDPSRTALIIAVTYGGEVARARGELSRLGPEAASDLVLDLRRETTAYAMLLRRHLAHEAMTETRFTDLCAPHGLEADRVGDLLAGRAVPTAAELAIVAGVLRVTPRDLMPPTRTLHDEVVVVRRTEAETYPYPSEGSSSYEITRLARSRQQPCLKSFVIRVLPGRRGAELRVGLHQYLYNHGDVEIALIARHGSDERHVALAPGDSAYIAPMTACRFECASAEAGALYVVRVPGDLHPDAVFELSGLAPSSLARAAGETTRWF